MDEQYLVAVLASVGLTPALQAKVEAGGAVDRALRASPALDDLLIRSLKVGDDGRVEVQVNLERISRVVRKVAYGLFCLRYGQSCSLTALTIRWIGPIGFDPPPNVFAAQWYWPGIKPKKWTVVQPSVFEFVFSKGWMVDDAPLMCIMNLHDTIVAAVGCPAPTSRPERRFNQKPWR